VTESAECPLYFLLKGFSLFVFQVLESGSRRVAPLRGSLDFRPPPLTLTLTLTLPLHHRPWLQGGGAAMSEADSFDSFLPDGLEGPGDGVSELGSDCEVVSGLASGLYAELERLILAHGQGAAAGLVPLAVATLETLQGACGESQARAAEVEREREENRKLLAQYERERAERKRIQEVSPARAWGGGVWGEYVHSHSKDGRPQVLR